MVSFTMFSPYDFDKIAEAKPDNYVNAKGNHECVEFVRQTTTAPHTSHWRKGALVKGSNSITPGTAIATFVDDRYRGHAAIYIGQDDIGLWVLDQWNKQSKVGKRQIRYPTGKEKSAVKDQNNGNLYYIVITTDTL